MTRIQYLERVGSTYWFRRAVPPDVRGAIIGAKGKPITEWRYSLGVKSQEQAKRLLPVHIARSNDEIDKARARHGRPVPTADPAITASPEAVRRSQAVADEMERASLEAAELDEADREAAEARAEADPMFAAELALRAAGARLEREREELALSRELRIEEARKPGIGIMELFDRYAAQPGRSARTVAQWRTYLEKLVEFSGVTDARRLTAPHVRDWRNHLRDVATHKGKRLSEKTINGSYLAAVRVVLAWGADDGLLDGNPAAEVKPVQLPKAPELRSRVLEEEEARTILKATTAGRQGRESEGFANAKRWIPWLLCYTGARVNELTQLRKEDVQTIGGVPVIVITPEAGTVKAKEARASRSTLI